MFSVGTSLWGSGGFSPSDVPDLFRWFDPSDASTLTLSGSNIMEWRDKGAIGDVLRGNNDPTPSAVLDTSGTYLTLPCVDFPTLTEWLVADTSVILTGPLTVFVVNYWPAGAGPNSQNYFGAATNLAAPTNAVYSICGFGGDYIQATVGVAGSDTIYTSTNIQSMGKHQITWPMGATVADMDIRLDGIDRAVTLSGVGSNPTRMSWVGINGGQGTYPWHGRMGEMIAYTRLLSGSEISSVESYLKAKWGTP